MVDEAKVLIVVLCHHVLIEVILMIEASVDSFPVQLLKLVPTNHSRALVSPFLDVTVVSHSYIKPKIPSWSRTLSPLESTHLERALARVMHRVDATKP